MVKIDFIRDGNLNRLEAMEEIESIEEIAGCHLNSDYNFSNISKKQHRYQAVFEITHY